MWGFFINATFHIFESNIHKVKIFFPFYCYAKHAHKTQFAKILVKLKQKLPKLKWFF